MSRTGSPQPLPDPGDRGIPRYCAAPLPPYRYVPGCHPRPGPGHVFPGRGDPPPGDARETDEPAPTTVWSAWCRGVDLFNAFYFWEAHEAWEAVWRRALAGSPEQALAKGMIQIAAALLKIHLGRRDAARRLARTGLAQLQAAAGWDTVAVLGVRPGALVRAFEACLAPVCAGLDCGSLPAGLPVLRLESRPGVLSNGPAPGSRRC